MVVVVACSILFYLSESDEAIIGEAAGSFYPMFALKLLECGGLTPLWLYN
jgi:hypothetical protein